jgi:hypothetical protein
VARTHRAPLTTGQLAAFLANCRRDRAGQTPHRRATAAALVAMHLRHRDMPAGWLPGILYAHGVPRMARALADILTYGEVLPY